MTADEIAPGLPDDVLLQDLDCDDEQYGMICRRVDENRKRVRSMPEDTVEQLAKEAMQFCYVDPYVVLFGLHDNDLDYLLGGGDVAKFRGLRAANAEVAS